MLTPAVPAQKKPHPANNFISNALSNRSGSCAGGSCGSGCAGGCSAQPRIRRGADMYKNSQGADKVKRSRHVNPSSSRSEETPVPDPKTCS
ncbi:hypothetical protein M8J76_006115 [Diaphorina citri]|nr:hypothetical protein M8J76_006115 [Diaphorina citri]